ncbi:phospholipid/cholesterol/gamma-HCH transport system substrate-binding protein [Mucilaginibacter frigoritolerans]|uniref:Phospholipid/cholesterol/gamma-HCH transport system substrate-binding protein n=1 Tax=Mucilaginibacter frigoritolerans TaxID=652788 RepID=A0A562U967_9SPHI|nr:MlaD family protein [Mucilaginibacter frigoritolerans]TWJ02352.1 phospholipid/cholesterol/gamma-HCH transport system substrate-binding protein [Mucilaginibacter frigoritolerans]
MASGDNKRAITVGIFLSLGLVIFILGVFTLGGQQKSFEKNIHISAVFDDVSGLKKGNDVWFSGVKVGTISSIKFVGISQVDVKMRIDESTQQYIHRNSGVKISSDGFIGNKIIVIDGGSPQAPVVQEGDVLQAEKLTSTDDIIKTLQQNNQNLLAITTDFKLLSHKILQGKGTVGTLLADSLMGEQLRKSMTNLQAATSSAAHLAVELDRFSNKMNTKGGFADKLLTDTATFNRIKGAVTQLQVAANNASVLTENLNKASNKLNSTDNAIGVLLNDPKGAVQVQTTLNNLQQSSVKLNEDLEAAQHNFLLKGFFKSKEKAKQDSIKAANKK